MNVELQRLRDQAEENCLAALHASDRDSADAWERIGMAIDQCLVSIRQDWRVIEERKGLFQRTG